jgi:plastocyanin
MPGSRWTVSISLFLALALCASLGLASKKNSDDDTKLVSMKKMKFTPSSLTIKVGQTVKWKNKDSHDHTVEADDGKSFKSGNLRNGDTFTHKFTKAGKYKYACSYHPRMKGEIVVKEK